KLWDVATGRMIQTFRRDDRNAVWKVAFSPDGRRLLSGSYKTFQLWDATTGRLVRTFEEHTKTVWPVAFSPDGRYLLTGSFDKTLKLWDAASGQLVRSFDGVSF